MQNKISCLVIGNGGREHAIAWKCAQSQYCEKVWVAPGNAGTELESLIDNIDINSNQPDKIIDFCQQKNIQLVIIGPEAPLAEGLGDLLRQHKIACIGPSKAAAQLESSKVFSKQFMQKNHIATAKAASFSQLQDALDYIAGQTFPLVLKADGLAAGKGVIIAHKLEEAQGAARKLMLSPQYGQTGGKIIVEEFIKGVELSYIVLANDTQYIPLASSQDHKAAYNHDLGPKYWWHGRILTLALVIS